VTRKLNGSGLRRPDWPLLLEVYIERHRTTPFEWGAHDCATFALGWVDLAREDLGPQIEVLAASLDYRTAEGAVTRLGRRALADAVDEWDHLTPVEPSFAQRGDVVVIEISGRQSLAVCAGEYAAGPGATGLELVPMTTARAAWRV
jgi:hypothetical protein